MFVVTDASPLILLARIEHLFLLPELFGSVVTPRTVFEEVTSDAELPGSQAVGDAEWLEVLDSGSQDEKALRSSLRSELDQGEAAAIALAKSRTADLLLLDERQGRRVAESLGLDVKGTLGVLLMAKREGLIDRLRPVLGRLRAEGAWISDDLFRAILEAADEAPDDDLPDDDAPSE